MRHLRPDSSKMSGTTNQGFSALVGGFAGATASRRPITVRDFEATTVSSSEMTLLILCKTTLLSFGPLARFGSMQIHHPLLPPQPS
jgi:hypothetical protein